jgi:hypothetical protein
MGMIELSVGELGCASRPSKVARELVGRLTRQERSVGT